MSKKKSTSTKHEVRVHTPQQFEIRKNAADNSRSVQGYFATWNTLSHNMGFREKLLPGAFTQSLRDNPVQCLFNHDNSKLLGRTESQTLQVEEDEVGLRFSVKLPDTTYANDLVVLLDRGDAFECSFGFRVPENGDEWTSMPDGTILRTISTAILYEGSILVAPAAYPRTSANIRSCPVALRSKLKRESDDDNEVEDAVDETDSEERCECSCESCSENDDCENCTNPDCDDDDCDDCPIQTRAAHTRLLIARLRS